MNIEHRTSNTQHRIEATWIPPSLSALSFPLKAHLCKGEREVLKKRKPIKVSTWAERHRIVSMSRFPGPWRNDITPYLPGIMDAAAFPSVRTGILCKAPQIGGTETINNVLGYFIDRDPGPALIVYPDSLTGRENMTDRILPMIEDSRRLSTYLTGYEDDKASLKIKLIHMPIYLAWAGSASRLANKPIKHVVFDETDKYPEAASKKETDPIRLGEKRVITYQYDHKILKISTPTIETGPIWKALTEEAQVIFDYWVKCPGCGERHVMTFDQIKWNKEQDRDGKEIDPDPERMETLGLAWYECPHCHCQWDDGWRDRAAKEGEWRSWSKDSDKWADIERDDKPDKPIELFRYLEQCRPKKIGFHLPSWISPFISLSKVAADYLMGKKDIQARRDFFNAHKAEPYKPKISARKEDDILALRDDRERGVVPSEPLVGLTAVADTQDDGFWYEVRGWGPWPDQESWQITEGFAPSVHPKDFTALERIFFEDVYRDMDGNEYPVQLIFIDTGGHRTGEVYDWCRTHYPRVMGLRGHDRMPKAWRWDKPGEKHRKKGRDIPLVGLNVNHYKDMLANRLMIPPQNPGAWHLHKETTVEWARQMCAEVRNPDTGLWEPIESRANHAWDIAGYFIAMADIYLKRWPEYEPGKHDHAEIAGRAKKRVTKVARSKFMAG